MEGKTVAASRTECVHILMQEHMNGAGRLFGGRLMEWIDVVAGVVARRHSGCNVTTAAVDFLEFHAGAYVNDTVVLLGNMVFCGRTSMEVRVDAYVEELSGERTLINTAHLIMVAIDSAGRPLPVPPLLPVTPDEREAYERARGRYAARGR